MRGVIKWRLAVRVAGAMLLCFSLTTTPSYGQGKAKIAGTVRTPDNQVPTTMPVAIYRGDEQAALAPARGGAAAVLTTMPTALMLTETDATGIFTFEGLEPGMYTILAGNPGPGLAGRVGFGRGGFGPLTPQARPNRGAATRPAGAVARDDRVRLGQGRGVLLIEVKGGDTKNIELTLTRDPDRLRRNSSS